MARTLQRQRIGLDLTNMTDAERHELLTRITQTAPNSDLYKGSSTIQASVDNLSKAGATLKQRNDVVATDRQKLKADTDQEAESRTDFDGELRTLRVLVEGGSKTPGDVTGMGFRPPAPPPAPQAPQPPEAVDVSYPQKGHGKATVSARQSDKVRRRYVAQWSPEPFGPTTWMELLGSGRSRTVMGAVGTKIWVRFATQRGALQSAWTDPVLVTIP